MNNEMHIVILRRLRCVVRRKRPEPTVLFLFHDNAPAQRSVLDKDFLVRNNVTTLEHSPHSPDLSTAYSYLFH